MHRQVEEEAHTQTELKHIPAIREKKRKLGCSQSQQRDAHTHPNTIHHLCNDTICSQHKARPCQ